MAKITMYFSSVEEMNNYFTTGVPSTVLAIVKNGDNGVLMYTSSNNDEAITGGTEIGGYPEDYSYATTLSTYTLVGDPNAPVPEPVRFSWSPSTYTNSATLTFSYFNDGELVGNVYFAEASDSECSIFYVDDLNEYMQDEWVPEGEDARSLIIFPGTYTTLAEAETESEVTTWASFFDMSAGAQIFSIDGYLGMGVMNNSTTINVDMYAIDPETGDASETVSTSDASKFRVEL